MGSFVTGSREIAASPSTVWAILADVEGWPMRFTPHLKSAALHGGLEVGTRGSVRMSLLPLESEFTITSVDEPKSWSWRGELAWLTMDFDHRIETTPGGCQVTFDVDLEGTLAPVIRPLARLVYRPQMERALDLLVACAEETVA